MFMYMIIMFVNSVDVNLDPLSRDELLYLKYKLHICIYSQYFIYRKYFQ